MAPEPQVAPEPAVAPEPVFTPEPVAEVQAPAAEQPAADAQPETWYVVLRLADGEHIDVGSFGSSDDATAHARGVVEQISAQERLAVLRRQVPQAGGDRLGRPRGAGRALAWFGRTPRLELGAADLAAFRSKSHDFERPYEAGRR